jgi:hypothetical protein
MANDETGDSLTNVAWRVTAEGKHTILDLTTADPTTSEPRKPFRFFTNYEGLGSFIPIPPPSSE